MTYLKINMVALAATIGITYQQLQKYETAQNRISVSRLYTIAHDLNVPIGWFFEAMVDQADTILTNPFRFMVPFLL